MKKNSVWPELRHGGALPPAGVGVDGLPPDVGAGAGADILVAVLEAAGPRVGPFLPVHVVTHFSRSKAVFLFLKIYIRRFKL
jgi:hypothetical protein